MPRDYLCLVLKMPTCYNCNKEIVKKDNANVLAFLGFVPRTFCNNCYSSKERGFVRHLLYIPKQPINSTIYKVGLWVSTVILTIILLAMIFSTFSSKGSDLVFVIFFILFLLFVLIWQWILYFKAKGILAGLR